MMVKCVKLPVIQACIVFEGFLRGGLRRKNRVVSRRIYRIFTIGTIVILASGITKKGNPQSCLALWISLGNSGG
jgi:hypothetical protein